MLKSRMSGVATCLLGDENSGLKTLRCSLAPVWISCKPNLTQYPRIGWQTKFQTHKKAWWNCSFLIFSSSCCCTWPTNRWEDNIEIYLKWIKCEIMKCIQLTQDRDKWQGLVNTGMKLRLAKEAGNFWRAERLLASQEGLFFTEFLI